MLARIKRLERMYLRRLKKRRARREFRACCVFARRFLRAVNAADREIAERDVRRYLAEEFLWKLRGDKRDPFERYVRRLRLLNSPEIIWN